MKMLSIDASGKTAAVAVTDGEVLLAQSFTDAGLTHSQALLPMADSALRLAGVDISQIDEFALTAGPGSFTGLRIGAALVMGLAGGRLCRPVSTLEALAYNMLEQRAVIIPVMDARRQQVYTAAFESDGEKLTRLLPDAALAADDVFERVRNYSEHKSVIILGDGAYLFENAVNVFDNVSFPEGKLMYTQGLSVARAAALVQPVRAGEIRLNYLRMSQAERELKERNNK
ncbi:MAG: tRNA (adenosine(37)-N6)-threonylcarbamoyltransferase complex dimerization subunit type 1 TsaB [Clostridia bacterium]|nr:tRNA (adenosine(37)-N6)-threonylcarbamoyltransferase complex dimerization subunit type 1 TsaB [Clostridia bacterium]